MAEIVPDCEPQNFTPSVTAFPGAYWIIWHGIPENADRLC